MIQKRHIRAVFFALIVCLISAGFFLLLYHFDNKYTTKAEVAQDGSTLIPFAQTDDGTSSGEVSWLVEGWEFYPDQLIEPGDETGEAVSTYIGQYFSFSAFHHDNSPHGVGTYRLTVRGNGSYTMLIPEVFSACRIYVDNQLIMSSGSISPYEPAIKDLVFSFELEGEAQILIQTANYTHYYSGITYPPAIGSSEAISRLMAVRLCFYGFLAFTSLALALLVSVIWLGMRKKEVAGENFWLGILALSFSLRLSYPLVHALGLPGLMLPYVLESAMTALGLFCIVRIVSLICLRPDSLADRILKGVTGGFILVSIVFSAVMAQYLPGFVPVYGQIFYWYKALVAVTMSMLLLVAIVKKSAQQTGGLLAGLLIYSVSLICHALTLGRFEPAHFGWFEEWGCYVLVLCFAARMVLRNLEIIRENRRLNEHLQEEIARKTETLSKLLEERRLLLSGFAHDLKTPITSITTFTRLVELDNADLDEEALGYLNIIRRKTREIQEQLSSLHEFTHLDAVPSAFESLDLSGMMRAFYESNKPDMDADGIQFELYLGKDHKIVVQGDRRKLTSVLQNLVFNAASFTPEGGSVRLSLDRIGEFAVLTVEDTGCGMTEETVAHIFERFYTKRSDGSGSGMGLFLVKSIVTEHGGTVEVSSEPGRGSRFTVKLPLESK